MPFPGIVLPGQRWVRTVDLGHKYMLDYLVRTGSVRLPPFVNDREPVAEVKGTDLCRPELRLFQHFPRGSLKEGLSFFERTGHALPERPLLRDPVQ